jgi:hypothetical protein
MASTVAITIEGVLAQGQADDLPNNKPIINGLELYHGFKGMFKLALVTDCPDLDKVEHWTKMNGLIEHPYIIHSDFALNTQDRVLQWEALKTTHGLALDLVVDSDPRLVKDAFDLGIPAMLYMHPVYARPEFRPDFKQEIKPWGMIEEAITQARLLKEQDPRRDADTA